MMEELLLKIYERLEVIMIVCSAILGVQISAYVFTSINTKNKGE